MGTKCTHEWEEQEHPGECWICLSDERNVLRAENELLRGKLLDYQHAWIYYHSRDWDKAIVQMQNFITR